MEEQGPDYLKAMRDWANAQPGRQASVVISTEQKWFEIFEESGEPGEPSSAKLAERFGLQLDLAGRRLSGADWSLLQARWRDAGNERYKLPADGIDRNQP